jgi:hypothetical protein
MNCTFAQVVMHTPFFIVSFGFRNFAAFNGNNLAKMGFTVCVETVAADDVRQVNVIKRVCVFIEVQ